MSYLTVYLLIGAICGLISATHVLEGPEDKKEIFSNFGNIMCFLAALFIFVLILWPAYLFFRIWSMIEGI